MLGGSRRCVQPVVQEENKLKPFPKYGDKMTKKAFEEAVKCGSFIDYDGCGDLATATHVSDIVFSPSDFGKKEWPAWATHIVWYNR